MLTTRAQDTNISNDYTIGISTYSTHWKIRRFDAPKVVLVIYLRQRIKVIDFSITSFGNGEIKLGKLVGKVERVWRRD